MSDVLGLIDVLDEKADVSSLVTYGAVDSVSATAPLVASGTAVDPIIGFQNPTASAIHTTSTLTAESGMRLGSGVAPTATLDVTGDAKFSSNLTVTGGDSRVVNSLYSKVILEATSAMTGYVKAQILKDSSGNIAIGHLTSDESDANYPLIMSTNASSEAVQTIYRANTHTFQNNATTTNAVLTSTGNLGVGKATNASTPVYPIDLGTPAAGASGAQAGKSIALYRAADGSNFYGFGTNTDSTMEFHVGSATTGNPLMKLKDGVGLSIGQGASAPTAALDVTGAGKFSNGVTVTAGHYLVEGTAFAKVLFESTDAATGIGKAQLLKSFSGDFALGHMNEAGGGASFPIIMQTNSASEAVTTLYRAGIHTFRNKAGGDVMTITTTGLGIGTTTPLNKLHMLQELNDVGIYQQMSNASFSSAAHMIKVSRESAAFVYAIYLANTIEVEFKFEGGGNAYADGSWGSPAADYAEYFESTTGNAIPFGKSVVIAFNPSGQSTLVREFDADLDEVDAIIGISRPKKHCKNATVIGNNAAMKWKGKYLTNDFGEYSYEPYTIIEWTEKTDDGGDKMKGTAEILRSYNAEGFPGNVPAGVPIPDTYQTTVLERRVLSPDFDPLLDYSSYEDRDEKVLIALVGQIAVRKNATVKPSWTRCYEISSEVDLWYIH